MCTVLVFMFAGSGWSVLMMCRMLWPCQDADEVGGRGSVSFLSEYQGHGMECALLAVENRVTPAFPCGGFTGLMMMCQPDDSAESLRGFANG